MDKFWESFSVGFLLRSLFAGTFFVISYSYSRANPYFNSDDILKVGMPFALLSGVIIYTLHRSLIYPWIEWVINTNWARNCRRLCIPLISRNSIKNIKDGWVEQRNEKITIWADYAHLQYASALCILVGGFIEKIMNPNDFKVCKPLFWLALIFAIAGVVSDWRLHSVIEN
ncbi:MAG TPA: hypothetical protein VH597_14150 [Verrucomicrobiae bacterium]|jgi:hypothetical protein|nr:hypothetical protein [Verrucomicrobiae bacterium]